MPGFQYSSAITFVSNLSRFLPLHTSVLLSHTTTININIDINIGTLSNNVVFMLSIPYLLATSLDTNTDNKIYHSTSTFVTTKETNKTEQYQPIFPIITTQPSRNQQQQTYSIQYSDPSVTSITPISSGPHTVPTNKYTNPILFSNSDSLASLFPVCNLRVFIVN